MVQGSRSPAHASGADPARYDVTAIIKHLGAQKKFPAILFENPLNLHGKASGIKLVMNCEISQCKAQIARGMPHVGYPTPTRYGRGRWRAL
jgi:hypothetical protein